MGRLLLERLARSVEVANGIDCFGSLAKDGELREYVMTYDLLLYARIKGTVYMPSIRHQRQLSFDFQALWPAAP